MKRKRTAGFSLLEVCLALAIFAGLTVVLLKKHQLSVQETAELAARMGVMQVEQGLRSEVFVRLQAFHRGSCHIPSGSDFVTWVQGVPLASGFTLSPVDDALKASLNLKHFRNPQVWLPLEKVLKRCVDKTNTKPSSFPGGTYSGSRGIYFCANIAPAPGARVLAGESVLAMLPMIAEFYFTNYELYDGSEVSCSALNANWVSAPVSPFEAASLGVLFYTFHWVSTGAGNLPFKSHSSMMGLGNG